MVRVILFLLALFLAPASAVLAGPCDPDLECAVAEGHYRVYAPSGWDGVRPLGAVLHFHGFRESAADVITREDLRAFADRHGALLVAPHGMGSTWSHPGSPSRQRDEFTFIDAVLADLKSRYPIVGQPIMATGFSQGAAMVWNLACYRGELFTGFLAIAGTFWSPQPETCPSGAVNLIQIHGITDRTVPLEGRPIRNGVFRQGDVFMAMGMMRRANACAVEASRAHRQGALACERMGACASGKLLEQCFHPGGHDFDPSWLDYAWRAFMTHLKG
jgi:polyhydroxybutyrate depolymerase